MGFKKLLIIITLIFLFISLFPATASEYTINDLWVVEVNFNNSLYFNEEVIITDSVVYYPVEGLANLLKFNINKFDQKIVIEGTEAVIYPGEGKYEIKGQGLKSEMVTLNEKNYLPLKILEELFQVEITYNQNLLIINIIAELEEKEEDEERVDSEPQEKKGPDFSLSSVNYNFSTDYSGYNIDYNLKGRFLQGKYILNSNLRDGNHNINSGNIKYELDNSIFKLMKQNGVMYYKDGQETARISGLYLRSKDSPFRFYNDKTTYNLIIGEDDKSNILQSGLINYNLKDGITANLNYIQEEDKVISAGLSHQGDTLRKLNINYLYDLHDRGDSFQFELDKKDKNNYFGFDYTNYDGFLTRDYNQMRAYFSGYQDNTYFNTHYKGNFSEQITHSLNAKINWFIDDLKTGTSFSLQNADSITDRLTGRVDINYDLNDRIATKLSFDRDFLKNDNTYGLSTGYSHPQYGSFAGAVNVYQDDHYGARLYWNKQFDQLRLSNRVSYIKNQDEVEIPFNLLVKYMIDNNTYLSGKYSKKENLNKYDIELNKDFQQGTSLTFDFVYQDGEDIDNQWEFKTGLTGSFGIIDNRLVLGQNEIDRGVVRGIVYLDKNNNGQRDKGEKGISDIRVSLDEHDITITNKKGEYVFNNVKPGSHEIKLDLKSIDIKYSPTSPGQQISLEEGEIGKIDLGLSVTGIADGYVVIKNYDQLPDYRKRELNYNKIKLTLNNPDYPITKFNNGYYFIDQLPPGEYTISLDQSSLPDWMDVKKSNHTFVITEEGEYVGGLDFVILVK